MLTVKVQVEVRPTESEAKVKEAVRNLLDVEWVGEEKIGFIKVLEGEGRGALSLLKLHDALRRQRILDAARKYFMKGLGSDYVKFYLNKQAAYVGVANFCTYEHGESPLGAIVVTVYTDDVRKLIDWLAPKTVHGKPVIEESPPDP